MTGSPQRRTPPGARARTPRHAAEAQQARRVLYAVLGVLALVTVIVLAGLYLTWYRPPRQHVATIGSHSYNAATLMRRARYLALFEGGGRTGEGDVVDQAIEKLRGETQLREGAPALVGAISADALQAQYRKQLGFPPADKDVHDDAAFQKALAKFRKDARLHRDELDALITAAALQQALHDHFGKDLPTTPPQVHLTRLRLNDRDTASRAAADARGGKTLDEVAKQYQVGAGGRAVDLGWQPVETLADGVRSAIGDSPAGKVTDPVPSGVFFDVYFISERTDGRTLEDAQKEPLITARIDRWKQHDAPQIEAHADVSKSERDWMLRQITKAVQAAARKAQQP